MTSCAELLGSSGSVYLNLPATRPTCLAPPAAWTARLLTASYSRGVSPAGVGLLVLHLLFRPVTRCQRPPWGPGSMGPSGQPHGLCRVILRSHPPSPHSATLRTGARTSTHAHVTTSHAALDVMAGLLVPSTRGVSSVLGVRGAAHFTRSGWEKGSGRDVAEGGSSAGDVVWVLKHAVVLFEVQLASAESSRAAATGASGGGEQSASP